MKQGHRLSWRMLLCCIILPLILSGCVTTHRQDTEREQRDFLVYSLGDYQVEKEEYAQSSAPIPHVNRGYSWTAAYTDVTGEQHSFSFNNVRGFGYQLYFYAEEKCLRWLEEQLLEPWLGPEISASNRFEVRAWRQTEEDDDDYFRRCIDPATGIRLQSITPRELREVWGIDFEFSYHIRDEDLPEMESLKNRMELCLQSIIEYFADQSILLRLRGKDTEHSWQAQYDATLEAICWRNYGAIIDEQNTVDGRLQEVRLLYVGDQLFVDANINYHESSGEYHIDQYYVRQALQCLGVEIEDLDRDVGIYKWLIGADEFILNRCEGTITQNGHNLMGYKFDYASDINQTVFGVITNTAVHFDPEKRALVAVPLDNR